MADAEQQPVQAEAQPVAASVGADSDSEEPAGAAEGAKQGIMTKRQLKKLRKQQYYAAKKQKRKEAERQRKQVDQERRRQEGRQRMEAMTEEERAKWREERNARGVERKQEREEAKARMERAMTMGQKIVVDLDFADLMTDTELRSMCGQLGYCWHINCAAKHPAHLALTSLQGKMAEFMKKQISGYLNWKATLTDKPYIEHFADCKEKLVYLTADSDNELQELDPEAIYIVGGLVDRNRHKLLCFNKAEEQGIAHARLPIGGYMKLASSQVMTTNHVMDIMLRWLELRDWRAAFDAVIPIRKRKPWEGDEEAGEQQEQQQQPPPAVKQQRQLKQDKGGAAGGGDAEAAPDTEAVAQRWKQASQ